MDRNLTGPSASSMSLWEAEAFVSRVLGLLFNPASDQFKDYQRRVQDIIDVAWRNDPTKRDPASKDFDVVTGE